MFSNTKWTKFWLSGALVVATVSVIVYASVFLWTGFGDNRADDSAVVATVDGTVITMGMLRREMVRDSGQESTRLNQLEARRAALEALIRTEVLARAALEAGYDKDPDFQSEYKDLDFQSEDGDPDVRSVHKLLLAQHFWTTHLRKQPAVRVPNEEVRSYYEAHKVDFEQPTRNRGSIVFLRSRAGAGGENRRALRQRAEGLVQDLVEGHKTFAEIAWQHSDDNWSRKRGGDIGWVTPGQKNYRLEQSALEALANIERPKTRPRVVETGRGIYLVQVTDRREPTTSLFEHARGSIRQQLLVTKQRTYSDAEYAKLKSRYSIEILEDTLR